MPDRLKVLLVCGRNQWRSPTAERIYRDDARLDVRSAGVSKSGGHELSDADLDWADLVLVMERRYMARIRASFGGRAGLPRIELLDIPDEYGYMDPELISLIRSSAEPYFLSSKPGQAPGPAPAPRTPPAGAGRRRGWRGSFQLLLPLSFAAFALAGCANSPTRAPSGSLVDVIVAKEREGLDALKVGDLAAFSRLTADDALFVDPHGVASKAEVMKNVAGFRLEDYTIEDVRLVPLSSTSGLIAYKITEKGNSHGREFSAKAYISALWTKRDGEWLCVFSQETPRK
jgi:predicted protein tyrosine phosphatase/ketosteroid isomerase-like protein